MSATAEQYFDLDGDRAATCGDCGEPFVQHKLSSRFLAVARASADLIGATPAIDRELPDGYVPLLCPPCERRDLALRYGQTLTFVPMRKSGGSATMPQPHEPVYGDDFRF